MEVPPQFDSGTPKIVPFKGFECQPGVATGQAPALQKNTALEWRERARQLVEGMVNDTVTARAIVNRLNAVNLSGNLASERAAQYERQTGSLHADQAAAKEIRICVSKAEKCPGDGDLYFGRGKRERATGCLRFSSDSGEECPN